MDKVRRIFNRRSQTDTNSSAGFGDPQLVVASVPPLPKIPLGEHPINRRQFYYQNQMIPLNPLSQISTGSSDRRRRRRRRRPRE